MRSVPALHRYYRNVKNPSLVLGIVLKLRGISMEFKMKYLQSYSPIKEFVSSIYFNTLKIRIACSTYGGEERCIQGFGGEN